MLIIDILKMNDEKIEYWQRNFRQDVWKLKVGGYYATYILGPYVLPNSKARDG